MADFRRWILALAVLSLFVGLAAAQTTTPAPLTCTASAAGTPTIRSEGFTELVGDIVITCSGGTTPNPGTQLPFANFTIYMNTSVTSRLLGSNGASEALLMIDEPGAPNVSGGTPPYGQTQTQNVCNSSFANYSGGTGGPATGCTAYAATVPTGTYAGTTQMSGTQGTFGNAPNVFQGSVTGNQVTFFGVPILAPGTNGSRIFRITNVRVNAAGLNASGTAPAPVNAFISVSGSTALPLVNSQVVVGYATPGLSTSVRNDNGTLGSAGTGFQQCVSSTSNTNPNFGTFAAILRYSSNFGTAFKSRTNSSNSVNGPVGPGATGFTAQNVPGAIYNSSESGFILPTVTSTSGNIAGLADFGTRFKAVFTNIPSGVTLYVSTTNVSNSTTGLSSSSSSYAVLVSSETTPQNGTAYPVVAAASTSPGYGVAPLIPVNGTATAVWEVENSNTFTLQNFNFAVFVQYSANTANSSPATGPMAVNMSFAPTPSQGAFSATSAAAASSSLPIPRFADTSTPKTFATVSLCQTVLLYPYITTVTGFETGLAIDNTTADVMGTGAQNGSCALNWFGNASGTPNPAASNTGTIAAGTTWTGVASATNMAGANFTGYMFAVCNFQLAHGYAAITDVGVRNILSSYLALVVPTGLGTRATPESLMH